MKVPVATYRIQFNETFQFQDALKLVPYLHELGISDLYCSPIFAARPGSAHGYDCTDPLRLNAELGSEAEFSALVQALHEHNMGLLLDIVPNHQTANPANPRWADVLQHGTNSAYARYFDIDWRRTGGKVILPILDKPLAEALDDGELSIDTSEPEPALRYHQMRLPLAPQSHALAVQLAAEKRPDLRRLLGEQAYLLEHWRTGAAMINYRRFFDIDDLVGVRVEDTAVFDASHELIARLVREGAVSGLRVDHVDGLFDPLGYLRRLRRRLIRNRGEAAKRQPRLYIIVEKILTADETLPPAWPVAGTTGYDFLNTLNGLFIDPAGLEQITATYQQFTGRPASLADVIYEQKRRIVTSLFAAELQHLSEELHRLARRCGEGDDCSPGDLEDALVEIAACFPVYRTYARRYALAPEDRRNVDRAVREARRRSATASHGALDFVARALRLEMPASLPPAAQRDWLTFVMRWQQFTGPATAKGLEDTALYLYNALLSANDVGADPDGPAALDLTAFHQRNEERLRDWPDTMNATATHDTKRGEDVRARLNVLTELTSEWADRLRTWRRLNADKRRLVGGHDTPDPNEEVLLYQTLLGAWPAEERDVPAFRDRLTAYVVKAAREAKTHTSWRDPRGDYEEALVAFAQRVLSSEAFLADFLPFQKKVASYGAVNSLGQLVLKATSPGVPDFYRGTELWDLNLVDPDNRRPVDFALRRRSLDDLNRREAEDRPALIEELLEHWQDGRIKLYVTAKLLNARRRHADVFSRGGYLPVFASKSHREQLVSFARHRRGTWLLVVVPRLVARLCAPGVLPLGAGVWGDSVLEMPGDAPPRWTNVLTGDVVDADSRSDLLAASVFEHLPVALMVGGRGAESR